jgi:GAF domain-containing protein
MLDHERDQLSPNSRSGETAAQDQLAAIMAVSRAVAEGQALGDTLATIAKASAELAGAEAAAIVLRRRQSLTGLVVAGSYGLSPAYADELNQLRPIEMGSGPSGIAAATRRPVCVSDVLANPIFGPWRHLAVREHYRALVSVPLRIGSGRRVIGVLNAYRDEPGDWSQDHVDVLMSLADHAAIAIQTARLLDESRRRVRGLSLVVRSLRTQSHEHANLIHALYGLLAFDEVEEARQLIARADTRLQAVQQSVSGNIENSVVAGVLLAEAAIADNAGVELVIDPESRLAELPATLTDLDVVTILGNLIHNATEAVAGLPRDRRRVVVRLVDGDGGLLIDVRDWGSGVPDEIGEELFEPGRTSKAEHVGVGLSLVRGIVTDADGQISFERMDPGTRFTVRVSV